MKRITLALNWKLYLNELQSIEFVERLNHSKDQFDNIDLEIYPSATAIRSVKNVLNNSSIKIGLQDFSIFENGAHTGSLSLSSIEVDSCIIGHSERRDFYKENDNLILKKLRISNDKKINTILCVGETLKEKEEGISKEKIKSQLSILKNLDIQTPLTIAYEPIWSIGTGSVPSNEYISDMLSTIKSELKALYSHEQNSAIKLFYGGSVDETNISNLSDISLLDGFLIGSAGSKFEKLINMVNSLV
jgi:triosephosphate isomerase